MATGAGRCETPRRIRPPFATGPPTGSGGRPRRSGTKHNNNHWRDLQSPRTIEVFERKLHPRPLGQGYTCRRPRPTCFPPPCPAAPPLACGGRRGGAADWSPLPPRRGWLKNTLPQGRPARDAVVAPPPHPLRGSKSCPEAPGSRGPPRAVASVDRRPCSDCDPRSGGNTR
ncbi:hypothetical protein H6P81_016054 [Aristolochia fimbriata]|uniref:Uncharacterized protein n=1 Tax=Aristolochia fimbriata TaxID=158543 RepID=A0AAV7E8Z7_ARIFI|nr:hypothetical protein H6P81_016054 [Aristolochia fimbriata]